MLYLKFTSEGFGVADDSFHLVKTLFGIGGSLNGHKNGFCFRLMTVKVK